NARDEASAELSPGAAARRAERLFVRRGYQRVRRDVRLFGADSATGPLGDCGVPAGTTVEPECPGGPVAGGITGEIDGGRNREVSAQEFKAPASVDRLQRAGLMAGGVAALMAVYGLTK